MIDVQPHTNILLLLVVQILTVFFYLNDVEAGGGTNFPELDLVRAVHERLGVMCFVFVR